MTVRRAGGVACGGCGRHLRDDLVRFAFLPGTTSEDQFPAGLLPDNPP